MRILVVSQYFWPEAFRINDLVGEWLARGHEVTVLTGIPNYPGGKIFDSYRAQPNHFSHYLGASVVRVPMLARGTGGVRLVLNYLSFVMTGLLFGAWKLRGLKIDVIFVFEPSPVTVGLPAVFLGKVKRAPIVFWALDLWPETLASMGVVKSPIVLAWIGKVVQFIYDRCALVLGQSRSFLGSIASHCTDHKKVRYFPNWAEDVFNNGACVAAAPEVPKIEDGFTVVFAGNIGEAQDMPAVLNAAQLLKDNDSIRWVVIGEGRKFKWLQSEVIRRGLQGRILLTGRYPLERMPSFFAHADALLVSLKRDPVFSLTIPGKLQSYLMSGLPVLGMLEGEGAALIKLACAGLTCDAGDAIGLAKRVLEMAAMSSSERRQLGLNGQEYAKKEFGRAMLIDHLDALLDEAVRGRKPCDR